MPHDGPGCDMKDWNVSGMGLIRVIYVVTDIKYILTCLLNRETNKFNTISDKLKQLVILDI